MNLLPSRPPLAHLLVRVPAFPWPVGPLRAPATNTVVHERKTENEKKLRKRGWTGWMVRGGVVGEAGEVVWSGEKGSV